MKIQTDYLKSTAEIAINDTRHHHGNPAARLRVDQHNGIPVLLSGVGALVLKQGEVDLIDLHHKHTIEGIMRLLPGTPQCVSLFLACSLGGKALVHMRQLSIFGMICRLPDSILNKHAMHTLTVSKPSFISCFTQIRDLCLGTISPIR